MRIYLASSWRNPHYEGVLEALRGAGHDVYDFKNPPGRTGFHWSDVLGDEWRTKTTPEHFRAALEDQISIDGYLSDMLHLKDAQAVVLALPCGRSAHLELGYAVGQGKPTAIWIPSGMLEEPELMYRMVNRLVVNTVELIAWAEEASRIVGS